MSITLDLSRVSNAPALKAPVNLSGLTRAGLRQALIDAGISVVVFTQATSSWPEVLSEYSWLFGEGKS